MDAFFRQILAFALINALIVANAHGSSLKKIDLGKIPIQIEPITLKNPSPSVSKVAKAAKAPKKIVSIKPKPQAAVMNRPLYVSVDQKPFFDIPVTYNTQVRHWIKYFQGPGKKWFRTVLERSNAYLPLMQQSLSEQNLPQDLAYVSMIESGFSPHAISSAAAVGYWQFIKTTANRYGLQTTWWIDERRDHQKSTRAAGRYLGDLYRMFGSWYLTAAAYNMGEGRTRRLINKHGTKNFWVLSTKRDFPSETRDYIPKLLAAVLIAKAPKLYGFDNLQLKDPYSYDYFQVPGGTDLMNLAQYLEVNHRSLETLNPELLKGFVPNFVDSHRIRIPKGMSNKASSYLRAQL